jgi:hypothetical protein
MLNQGEARFATCPEPLKEPLERRRQVLAEAIKGKAAWSPYQRALTQARTS